jgi:hypothetical protein
LILEQGFKLVEITFRMTTKKVKCIKNKLLCARDNEIQLPQLLCFNPSSKCYYSPSIDPNERINEIQTSEQQTAAQRGAQAYSHTHTKKTERRSVLQEKIYIFITEIKFIL